MYPLRKNTPPFIRKWGNWLLVVVLLLVKSYLFDIAVTRPASVSWVLYDWLANAAAALIVALPVLLTRRKYPVFVILGMTDVWLTANIIYYRSYRLFITWHLLKLTSNMAGFWNSIVPYLSVSLLVFPALTVLAAICLLWESQRARWYEVCTVLMAGVLLSIGGSYSRWERKREQGCQAPFTMEWVNPCILPQDLSAHISENEQQPRIYIREHSVLSYPLYLLNDWVHEQRKRGAVELSAEEQEELQRLINPVAPANPPEGNLLIILGESFESWLLDVNDVEGKPVCPEIKHYIETHPVLYVKDVTTQIGYGMSGDGQQIVNTGLYPTLEGVACVDYGDNVYPNLAHFYPHSAVVNPCRNVWNQTVVSYSYGYKQLVEPQSDDRFAWNDSIVIDKVIETFNRLPSPACVQTITISGHIPFDSSPDDIPIADTVPALFRHYLQTAHYTDRQVGRLLNWADTALVMQNSTIVFTGDHRIFHAWLSDDIRDYGLRANLPFGTNQAGCPLIIASPRMDSLRVTDHGEQIDVFPTILGFIGQKGYFWKGFGRDLTEPENDDKTGNSSVHRTLSDKLIRMNWFESPDLPHYIAHAGGSVHRYRYSNSIEAVHNSLEHGLGYIELDLSMTSDGQLVAWHDWNFEWTEAPDHDEFMARKIYGLFTPIDFPRIDSIMTANPHLTLVTDKISNPQIIDRWLHPYKKRVWVECFSDEDYFALREMGYHVLASRVPPLKTNTPAVIRNYAFDYRRCADLSQCDGDCFALFGGEITKSDADSLFATDPRIRLVYIDFYE